MVQAFDHRAASIVVNPENINRPAQPRQATFAEHADQYWLPKPQFWVPTPYPHWYIGYKMITAPTNRRTFIATFVPPSGAGHSMDILLPTEGYQDDFRLIAPAVLANVNSFPFDFVLRQKLQGQNISWYIVEQLPVIIYDDYDRQFGETSARALVRDHVLRLSYTSHNMEPLARDLGYEGPPFAWNEEERRHLRARLDALYFHLYGLSRTDADYVLNTFPIVRREDKGAFGHYRTRDLILAYMNALAAGDSKTQVAI